MSFQDKVSQVEGLSEDTWNRALYVTLNTVETFPLLFLPMPLVPQEANPHLVRLLLYFLQHLLTSLKQKESSLQAQSPFREI